MTPRRTTVAVALLALALACAPAALGNRANVPLDPVLLERLADNLAAQHDDTDRFDATVWLKVSDRRLARFMRNRAQRIELLQLVYREAKRQRLDPDLVLAVMQVESAFDRFAVSRVGAQGLMQVMPFWRLEIGRPQDNLTRVETNIRYGTVILAHYLELAEGDLVDALGRYNGSRGRLKYPNLVMSAWQNRWRNKPRHESPLLQASCMEYPLHVCRGR